MPHLDIPAIRTIFVVVIVCRTVQVEWQQSGAILFRGRFIGDGLQGLRDRPAVGSLPPLENLRSHVDAREPLYSGCVESEEPNLILWIGGQAWEPVEEQLTP